MAKVLVWVRTRRGPPLCNARNQLHRPVPKEACKTFFSVSLVEVAAAASGASDRAGLKRVGWLGGWRLIGSPTPLAPSESYVFHVSPASVAIEIPLAVSSFPLPRQAFFFAVAREPAHPHLVMMAFWGPPEALFFFLRTSSGQVLARWWYRCRALSASPHRQAVIFIWPGKSV